MHIVIEVSKSLRVYILMKIGRVIMNIYTFRELRGTRAGGVLNVYGCYRENQ